MNIAERIVERLLETGEGDPNYQDDQLDMIVSELANNGYPGAYYKEFDAYQGVYLRVPGVDKFWIEDRTDQELVLSGEEAVRIGMRKGGEDADLPHSCVVSFFGGKPDISDLLGYIQEYHGVRLAHKAAHRSAVDFMSRRSLR